MSWLRSWPVPFASRDASIRFFGGPSLAADAWATGLECRNGGLWPSFEVCVIERTLREALSRSYWEEWEQACCPTLVVHASEGTMGPAAARAMAERLPHVRLAELTGAGHDVHLHRPAEWRTTLTEFVDSLDGR